MRERKWNRVVPVFIACTLAGSMPGQAAASGFVPEGYDAEKWERLQDNVLEYDEIEDLIKEYNPAVQVSEDSYNSNLAKKQQLEKELKEELKDLQETIDSMEKEGGSESSIASAQAGYSAIKSQADSMRKSIKSMQNASNTVSMRENRDNLSMTAQTIMISYNQEKLQAEVLQKQLEAAQAAVSAAETKLNLQMVTEVDVINAKKTVKDIEAQITELNHSLDQSRQSLCLMTGWAYDATPEIKGIPDVNLADLDAINLQTDMEKAIGNNYTLREYRLPGSSGSKLSTKEIHARNVETTEQNLKVKMESLYKDIQAKRTDYESALTKFQKSEADMQAADRKNQLQMLGREEYLAQQVTYLQDKAAMETAKMALFQTWQIYQWAVRGTVELQ